MVQCWKSVTGQRSNQLNYVPTRQINEMRNRQCLCGLARIACRAWNCLGCPKERASCPNRLRTASKFQHERSYTEFILPQRLERSASWRPIPQRLHVPSKGCRVFITSPYELLPKSHQTKGILLATVNQKQRLLISTGGSYVKSAPRPGSETGVRSIQSLENTTRSYPVIATYQPRFLTPCSSAPSPPRTLPLLPVLPQSAATGYTWKFCRCATLSRS